MIACACGKINSHDDDYCSRCGTWIGQENPQTRPMLPRGVNYAIYAVTNSTEPIVRFDFPVMIDFIASLGGDLGNYLTIIEYNDDCGDFYKEIVVQARENYIRFEPIKVMKMRLYLIVNGVRTIININHKALIAKWYITLK